MTAMTKWNPFRREPGLELWKPTSRWSPLGQMEEMMTQMGELFERWNGGHEAITIAEWHPQTDITEDDKEYLLKTELPEVRKEDVKVRVENGVLTIRGERKMEKEEKGKKIHRIERAYGSFQRSFDLPDDADQKQITSEFKDGVLRVHLHKNPSIKPAATEIEVK